ncbi:MAG: sugar phosphate isomerase/epimerase [Blastochloris sp.]|nr:sugar phosphate isomerase/epimerase [Blastochloris sp.]
MRSGLVSITFRKLGVEEVIALVRQAGLEGIEWGGDVHVPHGDLETARRVAELTQKAGLRVAAYGSYYRVGSSEKDGLGFEKVLASAEALGAPLIRVWPGIQGSSETEPSARQWITDECRRIAMMAAEKGVRVATEYHANTLTDDPGSARRLLEEVGYPNFRTLWQPSNGREADYCQDSLEKVAPWVENLHVFHWQPDFSNRRALAEGEKRWLSYLQRARELEGERYALMEFVPGDEPEAFLRDAAVLKSWLNGLEGA